MMSKKKKGDQNDGWSNIIMEDHINEREKKRIKQNWKNYIQILVKRRIMYKKINFFNLGFFFFDRN
jgi:hypothetical protein